MYKEGDKVKIRSWKSTKNEYGVNDIDEIYIGSGGIWFVPEMRPFCGRVMTIRLVLSSGNRYDLKGAADWYFSREMFDPRYVYGGDDSEV